MNLQEAILKRYQKKNKNLTIREISLDTKIQATRVFRIMNGAEMKISEYEIFKKKVFGESNPIEKLMFECEAKLSTSHLQEVLGFLERKISLSTYSMV